MRFVVMGYRHGHISDVITRVKDRKDAVLLAACEEDAQTRQQLIAAKATDRVFDSYARMLDEVECDVVAVGDYYGKRGAIIAEALRRGRHVLSDKPICTSLRELDEIERLARAQGLRVGCQLDLRDGGQFRRLRRLVREGEIGAVHAVSFSGQHPLMYGRRAGWYFEEGKHGGTINDIAIHGFDAVPWITGLRFTVVNAARNWNAAFKPVPHFRQAAQAMLTMDNGCGVLGDVSYFAPDSFGYSLPQYWRITLWGADGVAETSAARPEVQLFKSGEKEPRVLPPDPPTPGGYLESFLRELAGRKDSELTTEDVFRASRVALTAQDAADRGATNVRVP